MDSEPELNSSSYGPVHPARGETRVRQPLRAQNLFGEAMGSLKLFLSLVSLGVAIDQNELAQWVQSAYGLNLSPSDAQQVAVKEAPVLTQCDVSINDLKNLKDTMYQTSLLDLPMDTVKTSIFDLAEQHVDVNELKEMWKVLFSVSGVDLTKKDAQTRTIELVKAYAESNQVLELFKNLYSMSGVNLMKSEAQAKSLELGKLQSWHSIRCLCFSSSSKFMFQK